MIRKAEASDIESMIGLLKELFSIEKDFEFNPEKHRKGLEKIMGNDSAQIFVFEENKKTVAMCSVQLLISTVEGTYSGVIEDLVVNKEKRGQGYGKKLVEAVKMWILEKGGTRVTLLADKYNNPALRFYNKLNFATTRMISLKKQLV